MRHVNKRTMRVMSQACSTHTSSYSSSLPFLSLISFQLYLSLYWLNHYGKSLLCDQIHLAKVCSIAKLFCKFFFLHCFFIKCKYLSIYVILR